MKLVCFTLFCFAFVVGFMSAFSDEHPRYADLNQMSNEQINERAKKSIADLYNQSLKY